MHYPFPLTATLPSPGGSPPCSLSFHLSEHPKICLPRALRQTYIRKVGDTVNLLIPFQVIMPAHTESMAGTRTEFDLETDTKSPAHSRGAVVVAYNGRSHVTRSPRPNGPSSICTPEGGSGQTPCDEVRIIHALQSAGVREFSVGRALRSLGSYC